MHGSRKQVSSDLDFVIAKEHGRAARARHVAHCRKKIGVRERSPGKPVFSDCGREAHHESSVLFPFNGRLSQCLVLKVHERSHRPRLPFDQLILNEELADKVRRRKTIQPTNYGTAAAEFHALWREPEQAGASGSFITQQEEMSLIYLANYFKN